MIDDDAVKAIENLHRLKADGIITEAEFEQSKQKILFGPRPAQAPAFPGLPAFDGVLPAQTDHLGWITLPLRRYAEFEGRSSRKEFWMFQFLYVALLLFTAIVYAADETDYGEAGFIGKPARQRADCPVSRPVPSYDPDRVPEDHGVPSRSLNCRPASANEARPFGSFRRSLTNVRLLMPCNAPSRAAASAPSPSGQCCCQF